MALVTGGTRGIGRSIAARLRADGAAVTITGTRPGGIAPEGCSYEDVDFADPLATDRFAERMSEAPVDILVNNAGVNAIAPFSEIATADFDRIQRVNVRAPMLLCQAVLGYMRARGWGRIVNVSSIFGVVSKEERASYSASKFALDGMTASLAAEAASYGVLANCVAPGFIDTDLTRRVLGEAGMAEMASTVPARRLGRPEEVAELVAWLAGPRNTYMSGQNVVVDGGFTRT
ncbi:MAG: SDR family oxidoreductase [Actinobacteria bacterium]|nr:SDR family oxidoreductase [Actinomycetota bacterium]